MALSLPLELNESRAKLTLGVGCRNKGNCVAFMPWTALLEDYGGLWNSGLEKSSNTQQGIHSCGSLKETQTMEALLVGIRRGVKTIKAVCDILD